MRDLKQLLRVYSQVFVPGAIGENAPEVLRERRLKNAGALKAPALFFGVEREPGAENVWHMNGVKLFQEPSVLYLTGINQTGVVLWLQASGNKDQSVLFVPDKNPAREFWDGVRFGWNRENPDSEDIHHLKKLTGISRILPVSELEKVIGAYVSKASSRKLHVFYHQYNDHEGKVKTVETDHNYAALRKVQNIVRKLKSKVALPTCAPEHYRLRLPLDKYGVQDARTAQSIARAAFLELLESPVAFKNEYEVCAFLEGRMLFRSPYGLAFPAIIANGPGAAVLHYLKNDEPLGRGNLLLMDFGVRYGTQHADISRTIPVSGRYNPLQKLLYDIVCDASVFHQKQVKAGEKLFRLNQNVWDYIEERLKKDFFARGGAAQRPYANKPHGVSHLMGEQEHDGDPFRVYQHQPLEPGMLISNEPGIYGSFQIKLGGKLYKETLGIRIEDNLLITEKGCINLSSAFPKKSDDIEKLMKTGAWR